MFRGTFTAVVTPLRNGDVDFAALQKLIEGQIAAGITGIVAVGTTGESPTLTYDEKHEIIQRTIKIAKGRCKVIAGAGTNSTRDSTEATKFAEKAGADGALLVAPYYNKPSQEGLFRHFKAIAEATKLPIMLYNIPGRCSVDIVPDTVVRLAENCRNIVSIKEASGSVERVSELRRRLPKEFTILSGDDSLTLPFMSVGAVGIVSVASNLFPAEVCALVRACECGDFKSAVRVALIGARGRMGQTIIDLAKGDPKVDIVAQCDLGDPIEQTIKDCDVAIDFSNASSIDEICRAALRHQKAVVIGTTGHSSEQRKLIEKTTQTLPIVFASNFSVGVNALFALTRRAAEILGSEFEPQIVETHHTKKKDSPSGTAKTLGEILKHQLKTEIPIESIREGDVVGEHTVTFVGPSERIELTHRAGRREIFGSGALRAAQWVVGKRPGLYSMQDVLGIASEK